MRHATPEELLARLDALGISHRTYSHPPLHTVEQSKALRGDLSGSHIKNLFLRDKKRQLWLVTVLEDRAVDLKSLRQRLGAKGNLSFGSAELLADALGVSPGAVTPFALINDHEGRVRFVLDRGVLAEAPVNAHPLTNEATTSIEPDDLLRFAEACGHAPQILDFDGESREA